MGAVFDDSSNNSDIKRIAQQTSQYPFNMTADDYDKYALGDWHLQCGATLSNAHIAYKTFGDPKAPAIVYPTWYSGCSRASKHPQPLSLTYQQPFQTTSG